MLLVVAQVQAGEKYVAASGRIVSSPIEPEDSKLPQLVRGERVGGAGVAPRHVPGVLEEDGTHLLPLDLLAEQRLVKAGELVLDEEGHLGVRGQADGAVVGGLHPALAG